MALVQLSPDTLTPAPGLTQLSPDTLEPVKSPAISSKPPSAKELEASEKGGAQSIPWGSLEDPGTLMFLAAGVPAASARWGVGLTRAALGEIAAWEGMTKAQKLAEPLVEKIPGAGPMGQILRGSAYLAAAMIGPGMMESVASRGRAMEPFERAEGNEPRLGPEATVAAKEEAAATGTGKEAAAVDEAAATVPAGPEATVTEPNKPVEPEPVKPVTKAEGDVLNAQDANPQGEVFENLTAKQLRGNPDLIKTAPDTYQFKQGVDKKGLTDYKINEWNNSYQGVSTIHHTDQGDFMVEGHHRLDGLLRTGKDTDNLRYQILNGTDKEVPGAIKYQDPKTGEWRTTGVTPIEARAYGALKNIADQRGTAYDMALFMRDMKIEPEDVEKMGINLGEAKTSDAMGMAKLSPFLWDEMRRGNLKDSWGVVLGRELPDDPQAQNEVYKEVADKKFTSQELADMIRLRQSSGAGPGQEGLFGKDFLKSSTLPQQVKILGAVRDDLGKNARMMETAAKGKGALEAVGDTKIDQPGLKSRALEARQLGDLLPRFTYQAGSETNSALKQLAYDLAEKPGDRNLIYDRARTELPKAVRTDAERAGLSLTPEPTPEAQSGLFGAPRAESGQGGTLSGGIVPVQAVEKTQAAIRAGGRWLADRMPASMKQKVLRKLFAPETVDKESARTAMKVERSEAEGRLHDASARFLMNDLREWFQKIPDTRTAYNVLKEYEQTGDFSSVPENLRPVAQQMKRITDESHAEFPKVRNGETGYVEHYVHHLYADDPEKVQEAFREMRSSSGRSIAGPKGFLKQRYYEDVSAAMDAGLTPKFKNPVDMFLAGNQQQWKYITGQKLVQSLKDMGLWKFRKFGESMPGFSPVDDSIAQVRQYSPTEKGFIQRGDYVMPENAARILNNHLSAPLKYGNAILAPVSILQQVKTELSAFHTLLTANSLAADKIGSDMAESLGALGQGEPVEAAKAMARIPQRFITPAELYRSIKRGKVLQMEGLQGHFDNPFVQQALDAGMSFDTGDSMLGKMLGDAIGDSLGLGGRVARNVLGGVMKHVVLPAKLAAFEIRNSAAIDAAMKRQGGEPLTAVQQQTISNETGRYIGNVFGQIPRDNIHWTNGLKDAAHMIIGYPGWQIGTVRLFGQAGRGLAQFATGGEIDMQARLGMRFAAGMILKSGIEGAIIRKVITGKWPTSIYETMTLPSGQKDSNGNDINLTRPEYVVKDALALAGHLRQESTGKELTRRQGAAGVADWMADMVESAGSATIDVAASKLAVPWAIGYYIYKNADFFNHPITFKSDPGVTSLRKKLEFIAKETGTTFSMSSTGEQAKQAGTTIGAEVKRALGGDIGAMGALAKQAVVGQLGLTPTSRALRQTEMQNYVDAASGSQFQAQAQNPQQADQWQAKAQLEQEFRQHLAGGVKGKIDFAAYAKRGITQKDIATEFAHAKMKPVEAKMDRLPLNEVVNAYKLAVDNDDKGDIAIARRVLANKWKTANPQERATAAPVLRAILSPKKDEARPEA